MLFIKFNLVQYWNIICEFFFPHIYFTKGENCIQNCIVLMVYLLRQLQIKQKRLNKNIEYIFYTVEADILFRIDFVSLSHCKFEFEGKCDIKWQYENVQKS